MNTELEGTMMGYQTQALKALGKPSSWTKASPYTLTHHLFLARLQGDRVPEKRDRPASGTGRVGASQEGGNGQTSGQGRTLSSLQREWHGNRNPVLTQWMVFGRECGAGWELRS